MKFVVLFCLFIVERGYLFFQLLIFDANRLGRLRRKLNDSAQYSPVCVRIIRCVFTVLSRVYTRSAIGKKTWHRHVSRNSYKMSFLLVCAFLIRTSDLDSRFKITSLPRASEIRLGYVHIDRT